MYIFICPEGSQPLTVSHTQFKPTALLPKLILINLINLLLSTTTTDRQFSTLLLICTPVLKNLHNKETIKSPSSSLPLLHTKPLETKMKKLVWRRKERDVSPSYTRLTDEKDFKKVPKGYVPVVVGSDETGQEEERFLVHVKLLKEPCIAALLELAAEKFGYQHGGVLRVPCDAHSFRHTIDLISHCR